jgi:plasmid maintenance system antidote protein VapI
MWSEIVRVRVRERGVTPARLAEEIGLSREAARRLAAGELGPHAITWKQGARLAKLLELDAQDLADAVV